MPLVSDTIQNLLGGVSQQAPSKRMPWQAEEQINGLSDPALGLRKRPPVEHVATLATDPTGFDAAEVFAINISETQQFFVVVLDGDLQAFDARDGSVVPVKFPQGKAYLSNTAAISAFIRSTTVGNNTHIVNRGVTVAKDTSKVSPTRGAEALVVVRAADFGTTYTITINGSAAASFETITGNTPADRLQISTEKIATELLTRLQGWIDAADFQFERFGSTLHMARVNGAEFTLSTEDGLADEGLKAVKSTIQRFTDLPARAKNGFIVEIVGDPGSDVDNFWVVFDDSKGPEQEGVWRETTEPGIIVGLDQLTLPHILGIGGSIIDARAELPAEPEVRGSGGTTKTVESVTDTLNGTTDALRHPLNSNQNAGLETTFLYANLSSVNGQDITVRINFDYNGSGIFLGNSSDKPDDPALRVWMNTGPSDDTNWTLVREWALGWTSGPVPRRFVNVALTAPGTNFDLRIAMVDREDRTAGTRPFVAGLAFATFGPGAVVYEGSDSKNVVFTDNYPLDTVLTVNIDAHPPQIHTVVAASETATQVATALTTLIDALPGTSATSSGGVITITNDDGTSPAVTALKSGFPTTDFFNNLLSLTTDELVGLELENVTDGSKGIITSNTQKTIIVPLTGGLENVFRVDSRVKVTDPGGTNMVFRPVAWDDRKVGNDDTGPFPSIVGETIGEIFFYRGRLGLVSRNKVVLSAAGEASNLFRTTLTDLIDSDVIDVEINTERSGDIHSAVQWDERLLLFSNATQFELDGTPILSPRTVFAKATTAFESTTADRPAVVGDRIFFGFDRKQATQIMDYSAVSDRRGANRAQNITIDVPSYLVGSPVSIAGSASYGVLSVLTDADRSVLYVYVFTNDADGRRDLGSWSKWKMPPGTTIMNMAMLDEKIALVTRRASGVFLEFINLGKVVEDGASFLAHVDRRVAFAPSDPEVTFTPDQTVLALDTFSGESADTFLSAHTPESGFGGWAVNGLVESLPGELGGFITAAGELQLVTGGSANDGYKCTSDIGDGDLEAFVDIEKIGAAAGSFPQFRLLVKAPNTGTNFWEGIGIALNETASGDDAEVRAVRYNAGGVIETSTVAAALTWADNTSKRIGFRLVGNIITVYQADAVTGANESTLGTFTYGSQSTTGLAALTDGSHKRVSLFSEGVISPFGTNAWKADQISVVGPSGTSSTNVDVPFDVPVDGTEGTVLVVDLDTGQWFVGTRNAVGTVSVPGVDLTAKNILVGIQYEFLYEFSTLYPRKKRSRFPFESEVHGRTQLKELLLAFEDTTSFTAETTAKGRALISKPFATASILSLDSGVFRIPLLVRNTDAKIVIKDSSPGQLQLQSAEWEGFFHKRNRTFI